MYMYSVLVYVWIVNVYLCECFSVCPCGTDAVGLSSDQKGPCVRVEAVEIPSYIVVCVS